MSRSYWAVRRVLDCLAACLLLVLLSPLLAGVGLAVRSRMGRPVLFLQDRVGQGGKVFKIVKFRTMVKNAESIGGGYFPSELNLVPPLGLFLRRSSLDELPQLLNIVRGDMSFVGPRPALPDQVARYSPQQRRRIEVPQGITGLAQVRFRNEAPWSLRIEADLEYINTVGFRTDLRIVVATIGKLFTTSGVVAGQRAEDVDDLNPRAGTRTEKEL